MLAIHVTTKRRDGDLERVVLCVGTLAAWSVAVMSLVLLVSGLFKGGEACSEADS